MNETGRIRVIVADDYNVVRKGVILFLSNQQDVEVIGEAQNGQEVIDLCETLSPDVVLMDLIMPEMDGITATRIVHERWPEVRIIALTSYLEKDLIQETVQAGAIGYLLKNVSGEDLIQAIRQAFFGRLTLAPEVICMLVQGTETFTTSRLNQLEIDVLRLMVKGLNNLEISEHIGINRSTVALRISSILAKVGASNRTEAVAYAIQHNLAGCKADAQQTGNHAVNAKANLPRPSS